MEVLKDLFQFLMERKKFWLIPIIIVLLFLSIILVFAEGSAISSFIYTIF